MTLFTMFLFCSQNTKQLQNIQNTFCPASALSYIFARGVIFFFKSAILLGSVGEVHFLHELVQVHFTNEPVLFKLDAFFKF